ncbi:conjugal transfer protein TraG N-terminal domain-containing protein [Vibrio campbellii]|uniref:conjugal transfer protein TraG N-terminal domain-containing protein n=1 Tax=Vibrio harveyi group TaxID=717610 RepID=UPI0018F162A1|nr:MULTISPECIES: conjugal transfer protein TraG N-terminal domain-containing protein [Vibrio harveyi group]MCG9589948.1 conjugal transfer protein TraG N-terminal domain-containing protein [Vibrio harveyi]MCG9670351.1 conjugal transfer protein TraG N-terminal domain-containing protein [Vibrio harveyi]MCR9909666.1 conjugal transfer protein TraG N-terminal domain-containing protein [Vibrio campbellii]
MSGVLQMAYFGTSFFDLITGALGAYFYMIVWNVLQSSGLIVMAFLVVIGEALKEGYESDEINDEPHQQWGRLKVKLYLMLFIAVLACKPLIGINELKLRMPTRHCDVIPTVVVTKMNLTSDEKQLLSMVGPKSFVNAMMEQEKKAINNWQTRSLVRSVANRIFVGETHTRWTQFINERRGIYSAGYLASFIESAQNNESEFNMLKDIGLTLSTLQELKVAIWWQFVRNYMLGISAGVHSQIPCDQGVRLTKANLETEFIRSPSLADEFNTFVQQCHAPAMSKWKAILAASSRGETAEMIVADMKSSVPGNEVFLSYSQLYPSLQAQVPVVGWGVSPDEKGYSGDADAVGSGAPAASNTAGYPKCDKWWTDSNKGLQYKLAEDFGITDDLYAVRDIQRIYKTDSTNRGELVQIVLSDKLSNNNLSAVKAKMGFLEKNNALYTGHDKTKESDNFGSSVLELGTDLGLVTSYLERAAGFKGILRAAPLGASLVLMLYTAMLPLGLLLGRFSLGAVLGLSVGLFSIYMWMPYFRIVRWLDDNLVSLLGLGSMSTDKMLIDFLIATAYLAVPMVLTAVGGMAGARLASFDPIGASTIGSVAQKGAATAQNVAKDVAKKIVTKGKAGSSKGKG